MQAALPYIVVLQLLLTLGLAVLLFGLARQVGILHERVAPMGAMASDQGLAVGEMSPHGSADAGTGLAMCVDQITAPLEADSAYTVSSSVATKTSAPSVSGSP